MLGWIQWTPFRNQDFLVRTSEQKFFGRKKKKLQLIQPNCRRNQPLANGFTCLCSKYFDSLTLWNKKITREEKSCYSFLDLSSSLKSFPLWGFWLGPPESLLCSYSLPDFCECIFLYLAMPTKLLVWLKVMGLASQRIGSAINTLPVEVQVCLGLHTSSPGLL